MSKTGLFGKLPAHGDFISRRLPQSFISIWDEWLQCSVAGSQELLADDWLDLFLTGAIWRFALRPGVIDDSGWAGILVPSVDSVGRYFPLTLVRPLGRGTDFLDFIAAADSWFAAMEGIAISALQDQLNADQVLVLMDETESSVMQNYGVINKPSVNMIANGSMILNGENMASQFIELARTSSEFAGAMGVWFCQKTDYSDSHTLLRKGLPEPGEYTAMISGRFY